MKIAIGADSAGKPLLDVIATPLAAKPELEVVDLSQSGYYADMSAEVGRAILDGRHDRAILFCGTGIGVCISANKVPGIRAAQCHDELTAEHARTSNDAQVLVMGARSVSPELATRVVAAWLGAEFEENPRRAGKMAKLRAIEARYLG